MYNFSHPQHSNTLHHSEHNEYQHFRAFDQDKTFSSTVASENQTYCETDLRPFNPLQVSDQDTLAKQGEVTFEPATENKVPSKNCLKEVKKKPVDTSNFSIEERLVAAVWAHERKRTKRSISQIKQDFQQRFGREPPAKNTLLVWEQKLFSTGSVHDAPRPGRPVKSVARAAAVLASVQGAPALSQRARARALRLPRTTLRTILTRDLRLNKHTPSKQSHEKQTAKRPPDVGR